MQEVVLTPEIRSIATLAQVYARMTSFKKKTRDQQLPKLIFSGLGSAAPYYFPMFVQEKRLQHTEYNASQ